MSFLKGLFSSEESKEKKIRKYFQDREKSAQLYPSKNYDTPLGVYLNGTMRYEHKGQVEIVELPDFIDRTKAVQLCLNAKSPRNVQKMQKKFGKQWSDPGKELTSYLAVLSPNENERDKYVRSILFSSYTVSYYVYRNGLIDRYCQNPYERAKVYFLVSKSPCCNAEKNVSGNYGVGRWVWQEIYGEVPYQTRQEEGRKKLREMRSSQDLNESNAVKQVIEEDEKELLEKEAEVLAIQQYIKDNWG